MAQTEKLSEYIVNKLAQQGLTLATAESCTGGMVASAIVGYPGASSVFLDGIVSYSNQAKMKFLGVRAETLEKFGAVSHETANEMCKGVAEVSESDIGLSTTGIAGPDGGTAEKPVGLVYIGICFKGKVTTKELRLNGSRTEIREQTTNILLSELKNLL